MNSERDEDATLEASELSVGWPTAPAPGESFFESDSGWDRQAQPSASADSDSAGETGEKEATFWQETGTNAWPARPAAANAGVNAQQPVPDQSGASAMGSDRTDGASGNGDDGDPVVRAERLLAELREAIGAIGQGSAPDLSSVVSDLEVAVTPPGALAPENVTELREALLAARERPRDLDTIVDLTQRIDAMLALIIAYDRALAAIERSLASLRGPSDEEQNDGPAVG